MMSVILMREDEKSPVVVRLKLSYHSILAFNVYPYTHHHQLYKSNIFPIFCEKIISVHLSPVNKIQSIPNQI